LIADLLQNTDQPDGQPGRLFGGVGRHGQDATPPTSPAVPDGSPTVSLHVIDLGNLAATLCCLKVNGSIMVYASNGDREPKLPVRDLMQKNLTVYAMSLAGVPHPDRKRAQTDIAAWTAVPGRILSVAARFTLYETAAAHKAVEAGGKVGTVVVEPQR